MASQTDLIVRVLDLLGVTQTGQDPSAEDVEKVQSFIAGTVSDLKADRVAIIDPTNIPDLLFEPFAIVLASAAAPAFGSPRDRETVAAEKDTLRLAQASAGGQFTRRRAVPIGEAEVSRQVATGPGFVGEAQRQLQGTGTFSGSTARQLSAAPGFAGEGKAAIDRGSTFAGSTPRQPAAAPGFSGETQRALSGSGTFAGSTPRALNATGAFAGDVQKPLQASGTFAGSTPRSINASGAFAGAVPRQLLPSTSFAGEKPRQ